MSDHLEIPDEDIPEFDLVGAHIKSIHGKAFQLSGLDRDTLDDIEAAAVNAHHGHHDGAEMWRERAGYGGLGDDEG